MTDALLAGPGTVETPPSPPTATVRQTVRVLHVINGEHYSGAERVQDLLAGYLPASGYEVTFACLKPGRFIQARQFRGVRLYELRMRSRLNFSCGKRLAQLVRDEHFALVHAHTPRSLMVGGQAARLARVPLIYHVHSPAGRDSTRRLQNQINKWLERRTGHRAARLLAVSPSVRRYMIEQGFLASHVVCVPNGVPAAPVRPRTKAPGTWVLGMMALFRPRKGVEVLLEALAQTLVERPNLRLRLIGPFESPAYEAEVRLLARRLGVTPAVEWTGFVGDVAAELRKIDLLVLPSLFGEGLPMVVLEAMAAGVPVVASDVEGVPEAIRTGHEGALAPPGASGELAEAIRQVVDGRWDYSLLSRQAQARHAELFSADVMARRVADVYNAVLGR